MFDLILKFDQDLFLLINQGLVNPFFDVLMPLLRNRFFWIPLYLFLIIFSIKRYGVYSGSIFLLFFLLAFGMADFCSASIIKPFVARLRPCNDPVMHVRSLVSCGTGYSFPSAHAANHFSMAVFLIVIFYKKWTWVLPLALFWAGVISFAQIYVGLHYPVDIVAGALLGSLIGYITGTILKNNKSYRSWKIGS